MIQDIEYKNQTSKELLSDLQDLFDLEGFNKTLEILKNQLSNTYINDVHKFLEAILKFKIHRLKSLPSEKYVKAIERKLSTTLNKKFSVQKLKLFLSIYEPLLKFAKESIVETVDDQGSILTSLKTMSIPEYMQSGLVILQPFIEIPSVIQVVGAINTMQNIKSDSLIFQISIIKEKISLLTRYSQELSRSIEILQKQVDMKNPKERNQIDQLKTKEKTKLVELSTNIGLLASLYCQIQSNHTTQEDATIVDELFSMSKHISEPLLDPVFVKIVEAITKQIINKPTAINVGPPIEHLINDADLAQFKIRALGSDITKVLTSCVVVGGCIINLLSKEIPNNFNRVSISPNTPKSSITKIQTPLTRSLIIAEALLQSGHLYNAIQIMIHKNDEINQNVIKMHKKIIEEIFKFLGQQVELDSTIQSLHNQYQTILDTTALHKQGIKSDSDYYSEIYILYDKILSLYQAKIQLMETYSNIRLTYNLPSQVIMDKFNSMKLSK